MLIMETPTSSEVTPQINRFVAKVENYRFLRRHLTAQPDLWEDMSKVAKEYIRRTEKIIRVLDGTGHHRDVVDYDDKVVGEGAPNVVIYLDKSARPVSWLVSKFWEDIADKNAVKPMTKFLNIDRNDKTWGDLEVTGSREHADKIYNFKRLPKEKVLAVRALFYKGKLSEKNWMKEVTKTNSDFDQGKRILIVDEVKSSGRTLMIAQNLLKLAFPSSSVSGVYFWNSRFKPILSSGRLVQQMTSVPVWYDSKETFGRGVGEKSDFYYNSDKNPHDIRFKLGSFILSTPHFETVKKENRKGGEMVVGKRIKDELAISLRQDIDQLHEDYLKYLNNNQGFMKR